MKIEEEYIKRVIRRTEDLLEYTKRVVESQAGIIEVSGNVADSFVCQAAINEAVINKINRLEERMDGMEKDGFGQS